MRVLIAGDFCPRGRVVEAFDKEDYASVLADVKELTASADWSIVNLECPIITGSADPIEKKGPNLHCSSKGVKALQYVGFKCVTLANNHFLDYGDKGARETITTLERYSIDHVGGGMNLEEASKILYKDVDGKCLAVINCCENEFSIATDTTAGCNPLNPVKQYYAIHEARQRADRVLVIVHGGHEHYRLPSPRMVDTYRFFIDAGADAVVNHHQHCFSGYEVYQGKPIFYGLGNFCFDKKSHRDDFWNYGYLVEIDFESFSPSFVLYPYRQCGNEPRIELLNKDEFSDVLVSINTVISDKLQLREAVDTYYDSCRGQYESIFEPFYNKFYLAAKNRGLLPSFISRKRKLAAYDYVQCESHRDKLTHLLQVKKTR